MSSATTIDPSHAADSHIRHFLFRRLHSLTGIVFGGYIVIHLLVNASLVQGQAPDVYQGQVDKIHSLPFLPVIETVLIYLPILFHTAYGIVITFAGRPNAGHYPYGKNVFYVLQRVSAMIIVVFILIHVLGMKGLFGSALEFDPHAATHTTVRHINAHWAIAYIMYPLGILASCFHLANGFWTAAITWGLTISAAAQRRWGAVCIGLFFLTFAAGITAWIVSLTLKGTLLAH